MQKSFGRPITYPFRSMAVGDTYTVEAPTAADVKRIARNASQYGLRHDRYYSCRTDRETRLMTVTRIR
jgi:hypothetical protein